MLNDVGEIDEESVRYLQDYLLSLGYECFGMNFTAPARPGEISELREFIRQRNTPSVSEKIREVIRGTLIGLAAMI
jgi:hypothetical protein